MLLRQQISIERGGIGLLLLAVGITWPAQERSEASVSGVAQSRSASAIATFTGKAALDIR